MKTEIDDESYLEKNIVYPSLVISLFVPRISFGKHTHVVLLFWKNCLSSGKQISIGPKSAKLVVNKTSKSHEIVNKLNFGKFV